MGGRMMRRLVVVVLLGSLAACQSQQDTDDPFMFGRVDCKRREGNPQVQTQFELDTAVCLGRAQAAALSGTSSMWAGSLGGALDKAITSNSIAEATAISCMAERGYLRKRRSEHEAMCSALSTPKLQPKRLSSR